MTLLSTITRKTKTFKLLCIPLYSSPRSEGLTQRQEADGSSIGAVQANGLVKNHQPKSAVSATGRSRWTLTYQGGPSETALNNSVTNVTAQIGGAAFLPCRVGHLGDRQVKEEREAVVEERVFICGRAMVGLLFFNVVEVVMRPTSSYLIVEKLFQNVNTCRFNL